jgi:hypothetical protein
MHSYVLYGLDESGRVLDADEIGASSLEKARKIAQRLARNYPKAELWDGMLCESRFARRQRHQLSHGDAGRAASPLLGFGRLWRLFFR